MTESGGHRIAANVTYVYIYDFNRRIIRRLIGFGGRDYGARVIRSAINLGRRGRARCTTVSCEGKWNVNDRNVFRLPLPPLPRRSEKLSIRKHGRLALRSAWPTRESCAWPAFNWDSLPGKSDQFPGPPPPVIHGHVACTRRTFRPVNTLWSEGGTSSCQVGRWLKRTRGCCWPNGPAIPRHAADDPSTSSEQWEKSTVCRFPHWLGGGGQPHRDKSNRSRLNSDNACINYTVSSSEFRPASIPSPKKNDDHQTSLIARVSFRIRSARTNGFIEFYKKPSASLSRKKDSLVS